ncbi:MAG: hypothetical protein FJX76_09940 [Armatimonadetes bacterium]|nr:hypothetical protein [Armatimonadota bacterium]
MPEELENQEEPDVSNAEISVGILWARRVFRVSILLFCLLVLGLLWFIFDFLRVRDERKATAIGRVQVACEQAVADWERIVGRLQNAAESIAQDAPLNAAVPPVNLPLQDVLEENPQATAITIVWSAQGRALMARRGKPERMLSGTALKAALTQAKTPGWMEPFADDGQVLRLVVPMAERKGAVLVDFDTNYLDDAVEDLDLGDPVFSYAAVLSPATSSLPRPIANLSKACRLWPRLSARKTSAKKSSRPSTRKKTDT